MLVREQSKDQISGGQGSAQVVKFLGHVLRDQAEADRVQFVEIFIIFEEATRRYVREI